MSPSFFFSCGRRPGILPSAVIDFAQASISTIFLDADHVRGHRDTETQRNLVSRSVHSHCHDHVLAAETHDVNSTFGVLAPLRHNVPELH